MQFKSSNWKKSGRDSGEGKDGRWREVFRERVCFSKFRSQIHLKLPLLTVHCSSNLHHMCFKTVVKTHLCLPHSGWPTPIGALMYGNTLLSCSCGWLSKDLEETHPRHRKLLRIKSVGPSRLILSTLPGSFTPAHIVSLALLEDCNGGLVHAKHVF